MYRKTINAVTIFQSTEVSISPHADRTHDTHTHKSREYSERRSLLCFYEVVDYESSVICNRPNFWHRHYIFYGTFKQKHVPTGEMFQKPSNHCVNLILNFFFNFRPTCWTSVVYSDNFFCVLCSCKRNFCLLIFYLVITVVGLLKFTHHKTEFLQVCRPNLRNMQ